MKTSALSVALLSVLALGCAGAAPGGGASEDDAVLIIRVAQPRASIWVDGRFVAEVAQARGGVAVSPGKHRLEVRHDDFHSYYQLVDVRAKERRVLEVELAEELP